MKQLVEDRIAPWSHICAVVATSPREQANGLLTTAERPDGQKLRFSSHSLIFLEGDPADRVFQVVTGVLMLYKLLADGRRQVVELLGPGDMFGYSLEDSYDCSAETLVNCSVLAFDRSAFERSPALLRTLNRCMQAQMGALREHAMLLGRKSALERVASFLLRCVSTRGAHACVGPRQNGECADVHLTMTRQEIADYLGLTIETVSRAFSELRRRGILVTDKPEEVRITDVRRVCRLTGAH
jgi:CRP/FNR family transcriptional regulator